MGDQHHGPRNHENPRPADDGTLVDPLEAWITELATELGLDATAIDRDALLATSRAAHGVTRAAAPFTIFLVGLAAGLRGGSIESVTGAATTATRLALAHQDAPD